MRAASDVIRDWALPQGRISWISPLARAVLKARVGDVVRFHSPAGVREIEVGSFVPARFPLRVCVPALALRFGGVCGAARGSVPAFTQSPM